MIWILFFPIAYGFLLDEPLAAKNQSTATGQYLTVSEFVDEKNFQHQETEQLRHDMDRAFALLTSQIQQKYSSLEQKYQTLEKNYIALQKTLAEKENQNMSSTKCVAFEKYLLMEQKYNALESSLRTLENYTIAISNDVSTLKQLQAIQPLQEIRALQQDVQRISAQTQSLILNEQARRQDFLALYNMTITELSSLKSYTNSKVMELEQNQTYGIRKTEQEVKTLEQTLQSQISNQSQALYSLDQKFERAKESDNRTFVQLQKQIDNNSEKVAMKSYSKTSITNGKVVSGIIKFDTVEFSSGINNLLTYRNTGKFICEKEGLYLISVSMLSQTSSGEFYIYMNGIVISDTYIGKHSSSLYHSGTAVVAVNLKINDNLWVEAYNGFINDGFSSQFVIVKIK